MSKKGLVRLFRYMSNLVHAPGSSRRRSLALVPRVHRRSSQSQSHPSLSSSMDRGSPEGEPSFDEGSADLLATLDELRRSHPGRASQMLLFEGDYRGEPAFVRDILISLVEQFAGNLPAVRHVLATVRKLRHRNVTQVLLATIRYERVVVLSEHATESVSDKIHKSRSLFFEETLALEDAIDIVIAVCDAGNYLHGAGVHGLHLKPSSVLIFAAPDLDKPGTFGPRAPLYKLSESCLSPLLRGASLAKGNAHGAGASTIPNRGPYFQGRDKNDAAHCASARSEDDGSAGNAASGSGSSAATVRSNSGICETGSTRGHLHLDWSRTFPVSASVAESFAPEHPEYLSVEELGGADPSTKSDIFSFAMLLWQLVHLRAAYPKEWGPLMILKSLQAGNRPHIDTTVLGIDSPLRNIIELCWAAEPARRPTFVEVKRSLVIAKQVLMAARARARAAEDSAEEGDGDDGHRSPSFLPSSTSPIVSQSLHRNSAGQLYEEDAKWRDHNAGSGNPSEAQEQECELQPPPLPPPQGQSQQQRQSQPLPQALPLPPPQPQPEPRHGERSVGHEETGEEESLNVDQIVAVWDVKARQFNVGKIRECSSTGGLVRVDIASPSSNSCSHSQLSPLAPAKAGRSLSSPSSFHRQIWVQQFNVTPFSGAADASINTTAA